MKPHVHSLNSSRAKQKFSFGKASRFQPYQARTDVSYLPSINNDRRSAIIGYGQRSDVADKNHIYYPHSYEIQSSMGKNGGNSLKAGRHQIGGPLEIVRIARNMPGPNYTLPSTLDKNGASMKSRLADISDKYIKSVPGPGTYSIPSSISNGQTSIMQSKYAYRGSVRISPLKSSYSLDIRTPQYQRKQVPGPGQYDIVKYGLSNPQSGSYKKQGQTKFGKQVRQSLAVRDSEKQPGPGAYKIYSEFDD